MTESEKFIFKTLQWFLALGVTLLLFGMGYMISFGVSMYNWQNTHERKQDKEMIYIINRLYIDSVQCQSNTMEINIIKSRLIDAGINDIDFPKNEAVLPKKKQLTNTKINLLWPE